MNCERRSLATSAVNDKSVAADLHKPRFAEGSLEVAEAAQDQCPRLIDALGQFRQLADPPPHCIIGLSNVSQRSQEKHLLDRTFLVMCIAHGLDSAILDPLDKELMDSMITAELLLNKQLYCDAYLEAYRR